MSLSTIDFDWKRVHLIDGPIPAPLPTMDQVCASTVILSRSNGRRVVAIGDHFVAKYGPTVSGREADTLVWLEQTTTEIRAPKLYVVFRKTDRNTRELTFCVIMERIGGYYLQPLWGEMDTQEKMALIEMLRQFFIKLRAIPPPRTSTPYCSPTGGPLLDQMFLSPPATNGGPFRSEAELVGALMNRVRRTTMLRSDVDELERLAQAALRPDARPIFSHGHLRLDHIFFAPQWVDGVTRKYEIVLVDWECAGWYAREPQHHCPLITFRYPQHWEYSQALLNMDADSSDWDRWLPLAFERDDRGYAEWLMNISDAFWPPGSDEEQPIPDAVAAMAEAVRVNGPRTISELRNRYGPDDFVPIDEYDGVIYDDETDDEESEYEEMDEDDEDDEDDELPYHHTQTLEFINVAGTGFTGRLDRSRRAGGGGGEEAADVEDPCIIFEMVVPGN
jgi:hypothetical protein